MSCSQLFTYFSLTINNPDENDLLIVRNPNEKYVRQCIWTLETGAEGTPHVQMYLRLFRNNSMSLVKKLYPRAHIKGCSRDEYAENSHRYAQKDDETTRGAHIITTSGTPQDITNLLIDVFRAVQHSYYPSYEPFHPFSSILPRTLRDYMDEQEQDMVLSKPYLAKMFVSPAYKSIFEKFGKTLWFLARHAETEATTTTTTNSVNPRGSSPTEEHNPDAVPEEEDDTPPTDASPAS